MRLKENLLHLRSARGMTQEQLAALLGVSRQSVAKWESGQSTPEVDRLVRIAELFGCTLDELVSGDVTTRGEAAAAAADGERASGAPAGDASESDGDADGGRGAVGVPGDAPTSSDARAAAPTGGRGDAPTAPPTDAYGYDEHARSFSRSVATGVACILAGIAGSALLDAYYYNDALITVSIIGGVAVGIAFLVPAGIEHGAFTRAHPLVEDFYDEGRRDEMRRAFTRDLVRGIMLVLAGVCAVVLADAADLADLGAAAMLALLAAGVWFLVRGGVRQGLSDVAAYNRERAEERRERDDPRLGAVCGIIMLTATIVGLLLLFLGHGVMRAYFWLPWPVGGIACGIASLVMRVLEPRG